MARARATIRPSSATGGHVKRHVVVPFVLVALIAALTVALVPGQALVSAQQPQTVDVPKIPFESVPDYFKYPATMHLGEGLAVAVHSTGHGLMVNHPSSATSAPLPA